MGGAWVLVIVSQGALAQDWPEWGRSAERNMSAPAGMKLPAQFKPGTLAPGSDEVDTSTAENLKFVVKLGSQSYGNPTVANGRIFLGTNNDSPRDPKYKDDRSVVYCLDEKTGELNWQLNFPKLGTGKVGDWEFLGICSSPTVVGDRIYFVSNLAEVVCADVHGMANGNDGPFTDESTHLARGGAPIPMGPTDGDIIWVYNVAEELGVFPHNIMSSSVAVVGDAVWASTSNGVDYGHVETPSPFAPSLIKLDRNTGELLGEEASGLSQRIFHCNWSSPAYLNTPGAELAIFGGPDGWIYGYRPTPIEDEEGIKVLDEAFRFDANPPEYRVRNGRPVRYATPPGPSEVIGTPVVYKGRVYATIGQDPEHGEGLGNIVCIDPTKTGDITKSGLIWQDQRINRSVSTPSIVDDLVYVADFSGFIYCYDANTGELYWRHDTLSHIWGSTLVADGRVFVGNEDGFLTVLRAGKQLEVLGEIDMGSPIYSSPIAANGVLYVQSHTHLYAFSEGGR